MIKKIVVLQEGREENATQLFIPRGARSSERIRLESGHIIGGDKKLDFSKPFMPESLAR